MDTANQRRHYNEPAVGKAIREPLFIQTKYTYIESQDQRLPYDPNADYPTQVRQSFESSIQHLGHVDSYLLHGPRSRGRLSSIDLEVWRTMEELQQEGRTRLIGISNATADQLAELCSIASVRPAFVQNRCFARAGWDREVRKVCEREGVIYQGFSLLTANVPELASPPIRQIAAAHDTNVTQVAFAFALAVGMICLTGTTDPQHMRDDLAAADLKLSDDEIATIEGISG
ncbi:MAG TPA: aldo/keto reductase [Thermoanaerobaculia bacterium]